MNRFILITVLLVGAQAHQQLQNIHDQTTTIPETATANANTSTNTDSRNLLSFFSTIFKSSLSKVLRFLFHSPISGRRLKTISCVAAYQFSNFDIGNTDQFEDWFNDESELTLSQAGTYVGNESITEYVNFIYSTYFNTYEFINIIPRFMSELTDDSEECVITVADHAKMDLSTSFYEAGCLESMNGGTGSFEITGDETFITMKTVSIFFPTDYLAYIFGNIKPEKLAGHVCSIMENDCGEVWQANKISDQESCMNEFLALDISEGDTMRIDGNSQGCRMLHSTFAELNPSHCPHLSFDSLIDRNGKIKCQISEGIEITDQFSSDQLSYFKEIASKYGFDDTMYSHTRGTCSN